MKVEEIIRLGMADMTQAEMLKLFPYEGEIDEQVYGTLMGELIPECCLPWVENIFVPGNRCFEAYGEMHEAYARLCQRLGVTDEDGDVEDIINSLLEYGKVSAMKMFEYGRRYQQMLSAEENEKKV